MKYDYQLRDSQKKCIEFSKNYINKHNGEGELLWNCKMRFGKCFTALSFALEIGCNNVLIMTHMPAVMNEWKDLIKNHKNFEGWNFFNFKENDKFTLSGKNVVFCSNQLYYTRGKKKELLIDNVKWDLVIVDEMHIAFDEEGEPNKFVSYAKSFKGKNGRDNIKKINKKILLNLTGTPLNAINNGMYEKEQIYTYSYIDEMRNTEFNDAVRMKMNLIDLPEQYNKPCCGFNCMGEDSGFSLSYLNPFLRDKKTGEYEQIYDTDKDASNFLSFLEEQVKDFTHSIWVLETEQSCLFVKQLIRNSNLFTGWDIKIVAGNTESAGGEFLKKDIETFVETHTKTICLTVHKGLTGITIPKWDSIIWLSETASPKKYFQASFRIQSSNKGKSFATIIDFNPLRAIKMIEGYLNTFQNIPIGKRASEFLKEFYVFRNGNKITLTEYYKMLFAVNSKQKQYQLGSYNDLHHGEELYARMLKNFNTLYLIANKIKSRNGCSNLPKKVCIKNTDYETLLESSVNIKQNFDKIVNNSLILFIKERFCSLVADLPSFLKKEGATSFFSFNDIQKYQRDFEAYFGISYDEFIYIMNFGLAADEKIFFKVKYQLTTLNAFKVAV